MDQHNTESKQDRINTTQNSHTLFVESYVDSESTQHRIKTGQNQHNTEFSHTIRGILFR